MSAVVDFVYSAWLAIFGFLPVPILVVFSAFVAIVVFIFILKLLALVWDALPFL